MLVPIRAQRGRARSALFSRVKVTSVGALIHLVDTTKKFTQRILIRQGSGFARHHNCKEKA